MASAIPIGIAISELQNVSNIVNIKPPHSLEGTCTNKEPPNIKHNPIGVIEIQLNNNNLFFFCRSSNAYCI